MPFPHHRHKMRSNLAGSTLSLKVPMSQRLDTHPYHNSKRRHIESDTETTSEHLHTAFKRLSRLRRNSLFCDVILAADDGQVCAHRVILASRCSYFRAMFMCGTRESWDTEVRLRNMGVRTLELVVQFIYNEKVKISGENVQDVLSAAEMMDLGDLKRMALRYMTFHINTSNCLAVWQVSQLYSCNITSEEAKSYALKNFAKVIETAEFLELPRERLKMLISDDLLRVGEERVVLEALRRWSRHSVEERRGDMPELFNAVRFHLFGSNDLVKAISEQWVPEALPYLEHALLHHLEPTAREICTVPGPARNPARRKVVNELAIIVGGHQERSMWSKTWGCEVRSGEKERPGEGSWHSLPLPFTQRRDHTAIGTGGHVIIAGGSNGSNHLSNVERYDAYTGTWQELPGMLAERNHLCGAALRGVVYVAGGTNDTCSYQDTAEVLDTATMRWLELPRLGVARRSCAAASVRGQIVVAGGAARNCIDLATVEMYDPRQSAWRPGPTMLTGRRGFGLVAIQDRLYALGGYTADGYSSCIEQLDLRTNTWLEHGNMPIKLGYFGSALTTSNEVMICGGVSNSQLLIWEPSSNHFTTLSSGPPLPYSGSITICGGGGFV